MKALLIVTAVLEVAIGLALVVFPSVTFRRRSIHRSTCPSDWLLGE
jgi:NADH:ubiquinone oxidoreductase subunit K